MKCFESLSWTFLLAVVSCSGVAQQIDVPVDSGQTAQQCPIRPLSASLPPLTITVPTPMVTVFGKVSENVTALRFGSLRTGARYMPSVQAAGAFFVALPSGRYDVELLQDGADFMASKPGSSVQVPAGVERYEFAPCADCRILEVPKVLSKTDSDRRGTLVGVIRLPEGTSSMAGKFPGSVEISMFRPELPSERSSYGSGLVSDSGGFEFAGR